MKSTDLNRRFRMAGLWRWLPKWAIIAGGPLGLVAVAILIVVIGVFVDINQRIGRGSEGGTEYGVWSSFQLDSEANALAYMVNMEITLPGAVSPQDMLARYDILYSRVGILADGEYAIAYRSYGKLSELIRRVETIVYGLTPIFDSFKTLDTAPPDIMVSLQDDFDTLRGLTRELVVETSRALTEVRERERSELASLYRYSQFAMIALVVVLVAIIIFLILANLKSRRLQREAEAGNRAKSVFLATMSHEIRTPLNGLIGMIEVLDRSDLNESQAQQVSMAKRSGVALLDIITDILDFSKLEHGESEVERTRFTLDSVIEPALDLLRPSAAKKGVEIKTSYPAASVETDPARLRQVIFNLIGNAIKFTDVGVVSVHVSVHDLDPARLVFSVSDSGIGIPENRMGSLFKEFSQVDSTIRRRFGGTGLGLAISKRLVTLLGGEIQVTSVHGQGSTFTFDLPVGEIRYEKTKLPPRIEESQSDGRSGRILVVEDNEINREVAIAMLESSGLAIDCAEDGQIAQGMVENGRYDLILMDVQMPVMDGLDATMELRRRGIVTPIVGLTGNAFISDRDACLDAGMNDFLTKPVTRAKMDGMLEKWLKTRMKGDVDA